VSVFPETSFRLDPRVRAMKEAEKAEKEAKKRAKHEERNKEKDEKEAAEKAALAAAEAQANEAKNAKEDKKKQAEKEKKLVQKERKRLRAAVAAVRERAGEGAPMPSPEQVDGVCLALDLTSLKALADALEPAEAALDACAAALTAALEQAGEGAMRGAYICNESSQCRPVVWSMSTTIGLWCFLVPSEQRVESLWNVLVALEVGVCELGTTFQ